MPLFATIYKEIRPKKKCQLHIFSSFWIIGENTFGEYAETRHFSSLFDINLWEPVVIGDKNDYAPPLLRSSI